ncbi:MAG: hypothetical protein ACLTYH_07250 [Streptococcus salivarius]
MTLETAERRFTGILDSQIKYLNKYPDQDIQRISHLALVKDRDLDILVFKKDRQIEDLDLKTESGVTEFLMTKMSILKS